MTSNPKIKTATAYALVTRQGRILVETCCKKRPEAMQFMSMHDEAVGTKVRRVTIVVEMK